MVKIKKSLANKTCHIYTVIMKRNKNGWQALRTNDVHECWHLLSYELASETSTGIWVEDDWIPVSFKSTVFWDVTPCSLTQMYRFGDACCLPLHGISLQFLGSVGKFLPDYTFGKKLFFKVMTLRNLTSHKQFWYNVNTVMDERGDLVRDSTIFSLGGGTISLSYWKYIGLMMLRWQNYIRQNDFCLIRVRLRLRLLLETKKTQIIKYLSNPSRIDESGG